MSLLLRGKQALRRVTPSLVSASPFFDKAILWLPGYPVRPPQVLSRRRFHGVDLDSGPLEVQHVMIGLHRVLSARPRAAQQ
jgi:hypothetical protein